MTHVNLLNMRYTPPPCTIPFNISLNANWYQGSALEVWDTIVQHDHQNTPRTNNLHPHGYHSSRAAAEWWEQSRNLDAWLCSYTRRTTGHREERQGVSDRADKRHVTYVIWQVIVHRRSLRDRRIIVVMVSVRAVENTRLRNQSLFVCFIAECLADCGEPFLDGAA